MHGILMIEPLYNQVIKGNKSQTRRSSGLKAINVMGIPGDSLWDWSPDDWSICESDIGIFEFHNKKEQSWAQCKPRYKIGEVLYLKEPYIIMGGEPVYKFDLEPDDIARTFVKFRNKLFMPAAAARAFIKITGIRCERLLDISEDDCLAEGIHQFKYEGWENYDIKNQPNVHSFGSPRQSFLSLYKFANKVKTIDNIWVFAYEFEYLTNYQR